MLLVAVSDSHDNIAAIKKLGDAVRSRGVSLVIHAGDWVSPFTARFLREAVGEGVRVVGVWGNNEGERPYFLEVAKKFNVEIAGDAAELEVAGRKIAVYHGTSPVLLKALAESGLYDIVIYGHTHQAVIEKRERTLVVNPGELCGCLTGRSSYALINVEKLEVDLIYLT
ncbi:metallophosphoesterase [Pyrobaculum aerophilum]|uniref:Phosphoesterase n=1 Tax=Pyrobaculum aerophilum TaxID=13773 RepID=A0A371QV06_9CREN|nr:metallophosphoesterase [Pyrobaculum aerophilum]RFA93529.1 YfcE family phosphodiesterase [Pyrobaculum aerophilum]RFA95057.1 YfcE family phosphodiesterase [Pyrobaculum aerophilum]